jgi:putative aldouronate transport system substrate-binding protein
MTDEVLNNPKEQNVAFAWARYARGSYSGPFVERKEYIEQYLALPEQKNALKIWGESEAAANMLPGLNPSKEESSEYGKIMNDVNNLVSEFTMKVIMGNTPVADYDKFITQLNKMDIAKAIQIQQSAFDRYNKR